MEILVNKIYRLNGALVRIHEVEGDYVRTTESGTYPKDSFRKALVKGQSFRYGRTKYYVAEDVESLDYETIVSAMDSTTGEIVDIPAFDDEGNINIKYISVNVENETPEETLPYVPWQKEIEDYISECKIPFSSNVINKIATTAIENKSELISVLSRHKCWNPETLCLDMIVDVPNPSSIDDASYSFNAILSDYQFEFGNDYRRLMCISKYLTLDTFLDIDAEKAAAFKALGLHIAKGMKPSRAINKFFTETGVSRIANYEKEFAKLSDYLTSGTIRRRITLSVNPMDYLRMSEGNSWKSCHLVRDHGCYSNGVFSYMMDGQSMVLSLLDPENDEEPYLQKKINRMMFFLNDNGDILQSRLYPQVRIPAIEDFLAKWVNTQIAECLDVENNYSVSVLDTACINYVESFGSHYRDYGCHDFGQRIWTQNGNMPEMFNIGHESYCVQCGEINSRNGEIICCDCEHDSHDNYLSIYIHYRCPNSNRLFMFIEDAKFNPEDNHYYLKYGVCQDCGKIFFDRHIYCEECRENHDDVLICAECGEVITEDPIEIDGEMYCEHCVDEYFEVCADCGEYERRDNMYYIEDREEYICEDCYNRGEYFCCPDCDRYYTSDYATYVEGVGDVCNGCLDDYYYCADCGRYFCSDDVHYVERYGEYICDECIDERYVWCEECEEYVLAEDATEIDGDYYCQSCVDEYAWRCDHCGELHMGRPHEVDSMCLCEDCFDEHTIECAECGGRHYIPDMVEIDGRYYCEDCVPEEEEGEPEESATEETAVTQTSPENIVFDNGRLVYLTTTIDRFPDGTVATVLSYDPATEQYVIQIISGEHTYYRSVNRDQIA